MSEQPKDDFDTIMERVDYLLEDAERFKAEFEAWLEGHAQPAREAAE